MLSNTTFPQLIVANYKKWGDKKIALGEKKYGLWHNYTWESYYEKVKFFCLGMVSLGLGRGDKVSIIGDNAPEWVFGELAVQAAGGIVTGVFTDCTPEELKYILTSSDSKFLIARDQEQVDKIIAIKDECPCLEKVVYWDPKGLRNYEEPLLIEFEGLCELGRRYEESHPGMFEINVEQGKSDDIACLLYTSGTGGRPKAAMHSYSSLLSVIACLLSVNLVNSTDSYVSYAPLPWIPEQLFGLILPLAAGYTVNYPEKAETVKQDIREISPSIIAMSPRLWEDNCSAVLARMPTAGFLKRITYSMFLAVGFRIADLHFARKKINIFWKVLDKTGELLLHKPLRDNLGLRHVRHAYSGGATMGPDTFRFFRAIGVNIKQVYGLTESGGINTCHRSDDVKHESVGNLLHGNEIRISEDGEILIRGCSTFRGYYKNLEETEKAFMGSWLRSEDAGFIDDDGHLICVGRLTELMDLRGGSKFSPIYIETKLKFSPYIKDAVAIGGKERPYVAVLIAIDFETVSKWAEARGVTFTTYADLSQKLEVYELIHKDVQRVNRALPDEARIQRFGNLYKELDPDEAELTRTRKLRRSFFEEKYPELVDSLYGDEKILPVESEVKYRDGRVGKIKASFRIKSVERGE